MTSLPCHACSRGVMPPLWGPLMVPGGRAPELMAELSPSHASVPRLWDEESGGSGETLSPVPQGWEAGGRVTVGSSGGGCHPLPSASSARPQHPCLPTHEDFTD